MPLLSNQLPPYSGEYHVGSINIEAPCDGQIIHNATLRSNGRSHFQLDTALFTLYYPAASPGTERPNQEKRLWLPRPISLCAEGFSALFLGFRNVFVTGAFAFVLWALCGKTQVAAEVDAPFRPPDKAGTKYPVVVFSHGFASSGAYYTHYCGELASRGCVVAALEHRDGSCPVTTVTRLGPGHDGGAAGGVASRRAVMPVVPRDLDHNPPLTRQGLKKAQLAFRAAEIAEVIRVLRLLDAGQGAAVHGQNARLEGGRALARRMRGSLDVERTILVGHSYGATGVLGMCRDAPSRALPLAGCIALDPGKHSGPLNDEIAIPLLVVHSHSWSKGDSVLLGRPHFDVVRDLAEKTLGVTGKAWFMTALDTNHAYCTDAPLILPWPLSRALHTRMPPREGVMLYVSRTMEFVDIVLEGRRAGVLATGVTHPIYLDDTGRTSGWQNHVAPPGV